MSSEQEKQDHSALMERRKVWFPDDDEPIQVAVMERSSTQDADVNKSDDYFGVCPECNESDGYLNIGRDHWGICHKHKTKWNIGSNLFSSWHDQTEEEFKKNAELLSNYREVDEYNPSRNGKVECKLKGICYCDKCKQKRKADCIDHYSIREAKLFKQYDGFLDCDQLDDFIKGDEDRDCIMGNSATWELMQGASVRVLIPENTTAIEAVRLLKKITNSIEQNGLRGIEPSPQQPDDLAF